ncbi:hypothetical protein PoB_001835600 [Plakobranchus ocellatus]|uniref:Uncharacterized protein n=1 Tax=Plakobranchus ocellatus TaxID=259542 RepID=A0AAV3YXL8_9GAST|nr:hypothetical protein PoB_001835600 [Plakobranchus ocellatus]
MFRSRSSRPSVLETASSRLVMKMLMIDGKENGFVDNADKDSDDDDVDEGDGDDDANEDDNGDNEDERSDEGER